MFYRRSRRPRSLARKLRLDAMECRLTPAFTAGITPPATLTPNEGDTVTLMGTATEATDPTAVTFAWSVTKDGGATPYATGTGQAFAFIPNDNGTFVATLTIAEPTAPGSPTDTETVTITALNVAPTATLSGPNVAVPGFASTFTLGATDPSTEDTAAGFTFNIDWNADGTFDQTVTGLSGTTVTHTFDTLGTTGVTVTATDKDGGLSAPVTQSVQVKQAALIDDPLNPGHQFLAVAGTTGSDSIQVTPAGNSGRVRVRLNGELLGTFGTGTRIGILGMAGDDNIHLAGSIRAAAWLDGGDGNDLLKGAKGNDVLRGGAGDDHLNGAQGADIAIGGAGADRILGGPGDDLMVAGTTSYDATDASLFSIAQIWGGGGSLADRVDDLRTGTTPLTSGGATPTVLDDLAIDLITGASGGAWVFAAPTDQITGNPHGLFVNDTAATSSHGNGNGNGGGNGGGGGNGHGHGNGNKKPK
jgi:Ca2+-binding RTX toxin-like protein